MSSDSSKELDSNEGTPRCHHSDSINQAEEEGEDREELTGEPAEEFTGEPTDELTGEPTAGPIERPAEETAVGCPTLGHESPLRSVRESEERVVIHTSEEEIDCLC